MTYTFAHLHHRPTGRPKVLTHPVRFGSSASPPEDERDEPHGPSAPLAGGAPTTSGPMYMGSNRRT